MSSLDEKAAAALRSARQAVGLLLAINMINYVDRYVLSAAAPMIRATFFGPGSPGVAGTAWYHALKSFGITPGPDTLMGSLNTAFLFSYMLTAPLFGVLADRYSRWKLIGLAVIFWSLASGASGLATSFTMLLVTRLAIGVGEAAYGPAAPTVIADLFPISRRGSVLAWFYMAIPVGSAIGYIVGGMVAEHWGWREAFYLLVPPGILLGVICFFMPEPPRGASDAIEPPALLDKPAAALGTEKLAKARGKLADYLTLLKTPSYVLNCAGMTAMTFALGGIAFWMPTYIHEYRGVSTLGQVNLIFGALTVVAGLIATLLGGIVGDRLSRRFGGAYFLVSGISMLLGFPCVLLALWRPFPEAWGYIFLAEFFLFFNTGPTNTILANVTHPSVRSTGYALCILVIHLFGDAISPPLMGAITDHYHGNMTAGFVAVSVAILLGGIFWLAGVPYLKRDTEIAPTRLG